MPARKFLLIDAGNTRVKWATASARGKITARGGVQARQLTRATLERLAREFSVHEVVLACVVPKWLLWFQLAFAGRLVRCTGTLPDLPLPFDYPQPGEIGADRIAAAVAIHAEGHWPAIIVSCGTAVAITVLDARGRMCGGVIAPGLAAQLSALVGATAQLPTASLKMPPRLPARSTREAIGAGVVLSYQGGVREMVAELTSELPGRKKPKIILTGGDAGLLKDVFGARAEVRPLLVAEGLRIIGARVFASKS